MLRLSTRARLALTAGLAGAVIAPIAAQAGTVSTVGAATGVTVRAAGTGAVKVTWSATSTTGVSQWQVLVTEKSADGSTTHTMFAPAASRSFTETDLTAGSSVTAAVAAYTDSTSVNVSASSAAVTVPSGLCAGVKGACVAADATQTDGAEQHVAQGFLHGLGLSDQGVSEMQALNPRWWRITEGSPSEMSAVKAFHPVTTAVLSDPWLEVTADAAGHAISPWQYPNAYSNFIVNEVQKRVADGNLPDYWDIQNEPNDYSYYNPLFPPTAALLEQQFTIAYKAIKSVLPDAKILGPSFSIFKLNGDDNHLGLQDFIDYATANNLQFAAISWHELNAGNSSNPAQQLPSLADHVQEARAALDASPVLTGAQIFVNEFDSAFVGRLVGWDLGHVIALEQADVDQANRACFEDCINGGDSLIDPLDGQTPRMTYWGRLAYAQMTGSRVDATSTQRDTTAMTSVDNTAGTVTTIIARHHGCSTGGNLSCPLTFVRPSNSGSLTLVLQLPSAAAGQHATVTMTPLAATVLDAPKAPTSTQSSVSVALDGTAKVSVPSLTDGSAYVVKVSWS